MKKKIIIIILIIILVFSVFYLFNKIKLIPIKNKPVVQDTVVVSNLQTNKINWLTYTNDKYGYSIKYPEKSELFSANESQMTRFWLAGAFIGDYSDYADYPDGRKGNAKSRFFFTISSYTKAQADLITLDDWVESERSQRQAPYADVADKKITIDGEDAYYLEYSNAAPFKADPYNYVSIYTIHNGIKYRISGIKVAENPSSEQVDSMLEFAMQFESMFNEMLNSFRFNK